VAEFTTFKKVTETTGYIYLAV